MPPRRTLEYWQSFSDIAMAFMATLVLVLIVLLHKQKQLAREDKEHAQRLSDFAAQLLDQLVAADELVVQQDGVGNWISHLFSQTEGCKLEFDPMTNRLTPRDHRTELYESGEVRLSDTALKDLEACKEAFERMAACMSPADSPGGRACRQAAGTWADEAERFRDQVEAVVITGTTDRQPYINADRLHGLSHRLHRRAGSFAANSQLGAERARQALGHLLALLESDENADRDPNSAVQVFMRRASIESPAFGPFLAGPDRAPGCHEQSDECEAARSLALRLRWEKKSLRKPFEGVKGVFCQRWRAEREDLEKSLGAARAQQARALCER